MRWGFYLTSSAIVMALAFSGCSSPSPGSLAIESMAANEGIIGLAFAAQEPVNELDLEGPGGARVSSGLLSERKGLVLFRVTSGRYCLAEASFRHSRIDLKHYGDDVCFEVATGAIGYVGHYIFSPTSDRHAIRFDKPSIFRKQLGEQYPGLAGKYRVIDLLQVHSVQREKTSVPIRYIAQIKEVR